MSAITSAITSAVVFTPEKWLTDLYFFLNKTVDYFGPADKLQKVQQSLNVLLTANDSDNGNDTDNGTVGHGGADHEGGHGAPTPILFIFASCALGALVRTILKKIPQLPYTVVLLVLGSLFGLLALSVPSIYIYTAIVDMQPHTLLHVFLPVLIFESAYAMEAHTFYRSFIQICILAVPGIFIASALTGLFCWYVFIEYRWSFAISLLFGSIISATDPVAVVALLKELGASKQLAILLEGESLMNDGTAIVLFNVLIDVARPSKSLTIAEMFARFFRIALGGPAFGFLMAHLTIFWLVNIFNDALTEITITLASTYITFYVGEVFLEVSGVLAVVVLGVLLSSNRTSISPEVETFLHRFWEMLAYLANTLIFIIVGVVITEKAAYKVTISDIVLNIALYCALVVIRALVVLMFTPLLTRIGYGLPWRNSTVIIWGGLRGAVGLTLALIVAQETDLDPRGVTQQKILLHTAGIVFLTLTVNATTIQPLLGMLGMSEISVPKRMAMASAVRNLQSVANQHISMYKTDRFLADADWDIVAKDIEINDPYSTGLEDEELEHVITYERHTRCPHCDISVMNEPSQKEINEMKEEARLRVLKAEKISYWKQFEHGMLSREAIRKLTELVDVARDTKDAWIDIDEIRKTWQIRGIYAYIRVKLEHWQQDKPDREHVPPPKNKCMRGCYIVALHPAFEVILQFIILVNVIIILIETVEDNLAKCEHLVNNKYGKFFDISNYVFIAIYTYEAGFKIAAFRKWYFKSKWNIFDFLVLMLSIGDLVLDQTLLANLKQSTSGDDCTKSSTTGVFSPSVLRIIRSVKLLRLLRSLRLAKSIIPQMINALNHQINKKLRFGYDVGQGYVMGEEDVQSFLESMVDNAQICRDVKHRMSEERLVIIKELGLLQKLHPGVAVSIKTQQASRRILNKMRDSIHQMRSEGVLDDAESQKLELMVEVRMKKLLKIPPTIQPPPPERIIGNLSWVRGDTTLIEYIKHNARLETMGDGEKLQAESDPKGGIYVIISGLVKVDKFLDQFADEHSVEAEMISDYLTTGGVLGEMSLLTGKASKVIVTCETSVQLYHISYDAIQAAIELFIDEPSLEYRLWRVCAIRMASVILRNQPLFMTWSQEKIKMYLEKCVIFLKKSELPEGGKFYDFPTFDINTVIMAEVILIHGVAEDAASGDMYLGPCFIPGRVERLILIPGKTDKHVITILPRDTDGLVMERTKSGSAINIATNRGNTSVTGLHIQGSMHRIELVHRVSDLKFPGGAPDPSNRHHSLTSVQEDDLMKHQSDAEDGQHLDADALKNIAFGTIHSNNGIDINTLDHPENIAADLRACDAAEEVAKGYTYGGGPVGKCSTDSAAYAAADLSGDVVPAASMQEPTRSTPITQFNEVNEQDSPKRMLPQLSQDRPTSSDDFNTFDDPSHRRDSAGNPNDRRRSSAGNPNDRRRSSAGNPNDRRRSSAGKEL